jgi:hypothetical protein
VPNDGVAAAPPARRDPRHVAREPHDGDVRDREHEVRMDRDALDRHEAVVREEDHPPTR